MPETQKKFQLDDGRVVTELNDGIYTTFSAVRYVCEDSCTVIFRSLAVRGGWSPESKDNRLEKLPGRLIHKDAILACRKYEDML